MQLGEIVEGGIITTRHNHPFEQVATLKNRYSGYQSTAHIPLALDFGEVE